MMSHDLLSSGACQSFLLNELPMTNFYKIMLSTISYIDAPIGAFFSLLSYILFVIKLVLFSHET